MIITLNARAWLYTTRHIGRQKNRKFCISHRSSSPLTLWLIFSLLRLVKSSPSVAIIIVFHHKLCPNARQSTKNSFDSLGKANHENLTATNIFHVLSCSSFVASCHLHHHLRLGNGKHVSAKFSLAFLISPTVAANGGQGSECWLILAAIKI